MKSKNGRKVQVSLENVAQLSTWPTPKANELGSNNAYQRRPNGSIALNLTGVAKLSTLADAGSTQARRDSEDLPPWESESSRGISVGLVADADGGDTCAEGIQRSGQHGQREEDAGAGDCVGGASPLNGFWRAADWLLCRDGRWRPVEPGTFPLVTGAPNRVGRLRGYGNAINAEVATQFIQAYLEVRP
jgi:DNA (cytosine-5)-methyltransferase 1